MSYLRDGSEDPRSFSKGRTMHTIDGPDAATLTTHTHPSSTRQQWLLWLDLHNSAVVPFQSPDSTHDDSFMPSLPPEQTPPAAVADGGRADLGAVLLEDVQQRDDDARAARPDWMTQRHRAAVGIHPPGPG